MWICVEALDGEGQLIANETTSKAAALLTSHRDQKRGDPLRSLLPHPEETGRGRGRGEPQEGVRFSSAFETRRKGFFQSDFRPPIIDQGPRTSDTAPSRRNPGILSRVGVVTAPPARSDNGLTGRG